MCYDSAVSYRELKSYQNTEIIYDFTVEFCQKYVDARSRTTDQMIQAARSGKQNIVEASANPTSEKSELYLLGIARASLQELLEDYGDFLRQRGLWQWNKDDPEAQTVRRLAYKTNKSYESYRSYLDEPGRAANAMLCLINQTNFLLDQQIRAAERQFVSVGDHGDGLRAKRDQQKKKEIMESLWRKYVT